MTQKGDGLSLHSPDANATLRTRNMTEWEPTPDEVQGVGSVASDHVRKTVHPGAKIGSPEWIEQCAQLALILESVGILPTVYTEDTDQPKKTPWRN